ncbi:MAG: hypothetical protein F6K09_25615 [Merismopedia sp. SIO2A8]|nr:hypothetical protein [Merismopedia sp. SIO2A8]
MSDFDSKTYEEYLIYIHGISPEYNKCHREAYDYLHQGISGCISQEVGEWHNAKRCDVEWGWDYECEGKEAKGHRLLAEAQEKLAARLFPKIEEAKDFSINPARLIIRGVRELMLKGFSDMFYYVCEDGQNSVRLEVLSKILEAKDIQTCLVEEQPFSITLLGHSAGSVIAFDLLLYLFGKEEDDESHKKTNFINFKAPSVESVLNRLDMSHENLLKLENNMGKFWTMAQHEKIRIRRLVTFGSPISQLVFRSDKFLEIFANDGGLNASELGLDRNPEIFGTPLEGPRWINLWDKDDFIAWPVKPLVREQDANLVADIYTNVSCSILKAHNRYWNSHIVHGKIAEHW